MFSYPAQIVFIESDRGGAWFGRLFHPSVCVDVRRNPGKPLPIFGRPFYNIREGSDSRFYATFQGGDKGSRRYRTFSSLTEAQKHAIRWAGQRFRCLVEEPTRPSVSTP